MLLHPLQSAAASVPHAGPFSIDQEVCLVGRCGDAVLDTRGSPAATVQVCVSGRVALSRLTVLHGEVLGHDVHNEDLGAVAQPLFSAVSYVPFSYCLWLIS